MLDETVPRLSHHFTPLCGTERSHLSLINSYTEIIHSALQSSARKNIVTDSVLSLSNVLARTTCAVHFAIMKTSEIPSVFTTRLICRTLGFLDYKLNDSVLQSPAKLLSIWRRSCLDTYVSVSTLSDVRQSRIHQQISLAEVYPRHIWRHPCDQKITSEREAFLDVAKEAVRSIEKSGGGGGRDGIAGRMKLNGHTA